MGWHGPGHFHGIDEDEEDYRRSVSDWALTKRMFAYTLKYRKQNLLMILAVLLNTAVNLLPPILFTMAIDRYITNLDQIGLTILAVLFVVINVITFTTQYSQNYLIEWLGAKMEYDMRLDVFRHLQKLSIGYYENKEAGSIVSRATNDIEKITELVSLGLIGVLADLLTLVGIVGIMLWMDVSLSLIAFIVIPMMIIFMLVWGKRVRKVYRETRKTIASVSAQMEESVSGIKEIQSYSKEGSTRNQFQQVNVTNMEANVEAGRVMSAFMPAVTVLTAVGQCLVLWFGGISVINGTLTVGVLFGFMSYVTRFFMPIQDLSMFWNSVQSALAAAERVFKIIDTEIDIQDARDAVEIDIVQGRIEYINMTFGYDETHPVLKNVNLIFEPNTTVALVGPTGVGKTTMINLLYRFYDPTIGKITVDGIDLRKIKQASLRRQMGIVLQDPFLFTGSIMENIKYSKPEASDEEVITVSKAIGAHEFIEKLPEGYKTDVKERGGRLSVGQRQLVSLARALLANPRILIMDEATSSIDAYTELLIQRAMNQILKGRTAIIIAHRLSTVRNADMIVVLEDGKIVEKGNHQDLLDHEGLYKHLYDMQFNTDVGAPIPIKGH